MDKTNRPYLVRQTLPQMFESVVTRYAECCCQWWKNGPDSTASLRYFDVGQKVRELAAGLMCLGIVKQDRIAIMAGTCPQWLWADFSILNSGAVTVTIYPKLSQREVAFIINDSGSRIIYVDNAINLGKVLNVREELPLLEKIIVMQDDYYDNHPDVLSLLQVQELGARFLFHHPEAYDERWQSVDHYDRATIIYSSGNTGPRRGVVHTHNSINAGLIRDLRGAPPLSNNDVFLSLFSLAHIYERQLSQMLPLSVGATISYADKSLSILENIQTVNPTVFCTVPTVYEQIFMTVRENASINLEDKNGFDSAINTALEVSKVWEDETGCINITEGVNMFEHLSSELKNKYLANEHIYRQIRAAMGNRYRFSFSGARALSPELYRVFLAAGVRIIDGYGLNETAATVTSSYLKKGALPGSVGPMMIEFEGKVLHNGEFALRGRTLFKEYWNDPEFTAKAFTPDGFFKTGDLVEVLPNGYLNLVGRVSDLLVLANGRRVVQSKVENQFSLSNYISQVCVFGHDQQYISALIVPNFDAFIKLFDLEHIQYDAAPLQFSDKGSVHTCIKVGTDFISNGKLKNLIDREIEQANRQLFDYESIQRYMIINRRFTPEADEVTPRMELKRETIAKNFAIEIQQLYTADIY
jgi:long-chain acyl-CoA synthetase